MGTVVGFASLGSFRGVDIPECRSAGSRGSVGTRLIIVIKKQVDARQQMEERRENWVEKVAERI